MIKRLIQISSIIALLVIMVLGYVFINLNITEKVVSAKTIKNTGDNQKTGNDIRSQSIYSIKVGKYYITQYAIESEINLYKALGNLLEKKITERYFVDGSPGLLKELKYDGIELQLIASQKAKIYSVLSIRVTGDKFVTPKGAKVGDTLDDLKKKYPAIKTPDNDLNNCTYFLNDENLGGTYDFLKFVVSEGIVKEIRIENDGP